MAITITIRYMKKKTQNIEFDYNLIRFCVLI